MWSYINRGSFPCELQRGLSSQELIWMSLLVWVTSPSLNPLWTWRNSWASTTSLRNWQFQIALWKQYLQMYLLYEEYVVLGLWLGSSERGNHKTCQPAPICRLLIRQFFSVFTSIIFGFGGRLVSSFFESNCFFKHNSKMKKMQRVKSIASFALKNDTCHEKSLIEGL
jgi:hypothetical protein